MRAIVCEQLGDPTQPLGSGVLRLKEDQPAPAIKPGCIRVSVTAASLNFPDALQVKVRVRQLSKAAEAAAVIMRQGQWCIGDMQGWLGLTCVLCSTQNSFFVLCAAVLSVRFALCLAKLKCCRPAPGQALHETRLRQLLFSVSHHHIW
jgi:hypothetical protein